MSKHIFFLSLYAYETLGQSNSEWCKKIEIERIETTTKPKFTSDPYRLHDSFHNSPFIFIAKITTIIVLCVCVCECDQFEDYVFVFS